MLWTCDSVSVDLSVLFLGDVKHGTMWMIKDHEAYTQTTVRPVSHAGLGVHLLLFWEAPFACMGPEATWVVLRPCFAIYLLIWIGSWPLCTSMPFGLSICMSATVCLLDPLSVKLLSLKVHLLALGLITSQCD